MAWLPCLGGTSQPMERPDGDRCVESAAGLDHRQGVSGRGVRCHGCGVVDGELSAAFACAIPWAVRSDPDSMRGRDRHALLDCGRPLSLEICDDHLFDLIIFGPFVRGVRLRTLAADSKPLHTTAHDSGFDKLHETFHSHLRSPD